MGIVLSLIRSMAFMIVPYILSIAACPIQYNICSIPDCIFFGAAVLQLFLCMQSTPRRQINSIQSIKETSLKPISEDFSQLNFSKKQSKKTKIRNKLQNSCVSPFGVQQQKLIKNNPYQRYSQFAASFIDQESNILKQTPTAIKQDKNKLLESPAIGRQQMQIKENNEPEKILTRKVRRQECKIEQDEDKNNFESENKFILGLMSKKIESENHPEQKPGENVKIFGFECEDLNEYQNQYFEQISLIEIEFESQFDKDSNETHNEVDD